MRKSRFTDEQIIRLLNGHEAEAKTAQICREHSISEATFYRWKAKYGGMTLSDAKRLKSLEDENRRLKGLVADQASTFRCSRARSQIVGMERRLIYRSAGSLKWCALNISVTSPAANQWSTVPCFWRARCR